MRQRCLSTSHQAYARYGGRGITIEDPRWHTFKGFWEDMGSEYRPGLMIDRIDNNKGYSPGNCRWVGWDESNRNRSCTRLSMMAARVMRRCYANGMTQRSIAKVWGVHFSTVSTVIRGTTWVS